MKLQDEIVRCANILKSLVKFKKVKIISHLDADGLTSASIIIKMLLRENINFELRIVKQLTSDIVENLVISENDLLILLDLGSGQLNLLKNILEKTHVFILDHHEPIKINHINLFHLNPLILGEEEISSSAISYLLAKTINLKITDMVELALIGTIADVLDEKWELKGLSRKILEEAEILGKVVVSTGLRLYGRNTRPIHKVLEYTFDPIIPGISGSESQAVQFLSELGISVKKDDEWIKLKDLTLEEQKRLASAIIIERLRSKHSDAEDIFGEIYTLPGKPEEIQDVREFATLLNACGRTGNQDIAIRICLNDLSAIKTSWFVLDEYKKIIGDCISRLRENKDMILTTDFATFLLCDAQIPETLIGTITSIVLNSNLIDTNKPIFGLVEAENNKIKISARVSKDFKMINLRDIIIKATNQVNGEGGGHQFASGGLIPKDKCNEFIKIVNKLLGDTFGNKKT
jgi:RecJ-like exonuclease